MKNISASKIWKLKIEFLIFILKNWISITDLCFNIQNLIKNKIINWLENSGKNQFSIKKCSWKLNRRNIHQRRRLLCSHSFYIFMKNEKGNLLRFSFFIFMKELKNELITQIKINFMIIFASTVYSLASLCEVPYGKADA